MVSCKVDVCIACRSTAIIWLHKDVKQTRDILTRRSAATGRATGVVGAFPWGEFAEKTAATALAGSFLGSFLLGGLESGPVDEPEQAGLGQEDDDDDDEGGEEVGLVVEDGDGLVGGADFFKPVELTHFGGVGRNWIEEEVVMLREWGGGGEPVTLNACII